MKSKLLRQVITMSRLTLSGLLIQCIFYSIIVAADINAQNQDKSIDDIYISLDVGDKTIKEVLRNIEKETGFVFSYQTQSIDFNNRIIINSKKSNLADVLMQISRESNLKFKRINNNIHIGIRSKNESIKVEEKINQQEITITGKVTSDEGELPGANVLVKGTSIGTVTDIEGNYTLEVPDENAEVVFSSVGYLSEEIVVGNRTVIDVVLTPDITALEEIVVVGYGTQTKKDLTSSISVVGTEELNKVAAPSAFQQLQGRAPGVVVRTNSHSPGSNMKVRIRGTGSISANSEPLILVDQLRVDDMNSINPTDIETMTVLKDASATAIYGAQGANGVILITTKQGTKGKTNINYDGYYGFQNIANEIDLVGAREHAITINEYRANQGQDPLYTESEINAFGEGTDWQDVLYRPDSPIQSHTLSASGGTAKTNFYLSGNFFDQQGVVRATDYKRFTVRSNISHQATKKLKIGANINVMSSVGNSIREGTGPSTNAGPVDAAFQFSPIHPVYNDDGTYPQNADIEGLTTVDHPIQLAEDFYNENNVINSFGNLYFELELIDGLMWKTDIGAGLRSSKNNQYEPINSLRGQGLGRATINSGMVKNWRIFNTLTYKKTFGDNHNFEFLLGQEAWESIYENNWSQARGFATDDLKYNNLSQGNGDLDGVNSGWSRSATYSYFGRLNYNFEGKYLLNLTVRNDGASVFGENYKRGWFPAASVGYRISEESFMNNNTVFSELKLKASYGSSGTPGVSPYRSLALIGTPLSQSDYSFNGQVAPISGFTRLPNPDLQWEESKQLNVGLEMGFIEDRIMVTAEYYNRDTENLLLPLPLSPSSGFTEVLANTATMNNNGFEFTIDADVIRGDFVWNINANASYNQNEVTSLGEVGEFTAGADARAIQNANPVIVREGEPIGAFYGLETNGLFQSQEEINNASLSSDGTAPYPGAEPGTFRFIDQNGDTITNSDDRTVLGSAIPTWTGGLTNTFSYKGFDLSIFMVFAQGNKILNLRRQQNEAGAIDFGVPTRDYFNNRWMGEGSSNEYQRTGDDPNRNTMYNWLLEDGSFIRAREITLGYNFNFSDKAAGKYINKLRLYASVQNAFTITNYTGYDPDVNTVNSGDPANSQNTVWNGIDRGAYPAVRTLLFGINLGF